LFEPGFTGFSDYRDYNQSWQSFNPENHGSDDLNGFNVNNPAIHLKSSVFRVTSVRLFVRAVPATSESPKDILRN